MAPPPEGGVGEEQDGEDPDGSPAPLPAPGSGGVPGSAGGAPGLLPEGGAPALSEGGAPGLLSAGGGPGPLSAGGQASGFLPELSWHWDFFLPFFFDEQFDDGSVVDVVSFFLSFFFLPALAAAVLPEAAGTAAADRLYR